MIDLGFIDVVKASVTFNYGKKWFLYILCYKNYIKYYLMIYTSCLYNVQMGSQTTDTDSEGLGWGLRFCICNEFPGYADAIGPGTIY